MSDKDICQLCQFRGCTYCNYTGFEVSVYMRRTPEMARQAMSAAVKAVDKLTVKRGKNDQLRGRAKKR